MSCNVNSRPVFIWYKRTWGNKASDEPIYPGNRRQMQMQIARRGQDPIQHTGTDGRCSLTDSCGWLINWCCKRCREEATRNTNYYYYGFYSIFSVCYSFHSIIWSTFKRIPFFSRSPRPASPTPCALLFCGVSQESILGNPYLLKPANLRANNE